MSETTLQNPTPPPETWPKCPTCGGHGEELCDRCGGQGELHGGAVCCDQCEGTGLDVCHDCQGRGGPCWVERLDDGSIGRVCPVEDTHATRSTP